MSFKKKKKKPKVKAKATLTYLPKQFFQVFEDQAKYSARERTEEFAKSVAEEARRIILEQRYDWEPLDPAYLRHKIKEGLDPRTLIATGDYVDHIGTYEKDGRIHVGPLPGIHEPSGLTYLRLSRIHEYGTETIPARPLWRPLAKEVKKWSKDLRKQYASELRKLSKKSVKRKSKKKVKKA